MFHLLSATIIPTPKSLSIAEVTLYLALYLS